MPVVARRAHSRWIGGSARATADGASRGQADTSVINVGGSMYRAASDLGFARPKRGVFTRRSTSTPDAARGSGLCVLVGCLARARSGRVPARIAAGAITVTASSPRVMMSFSTTRSSSWTTFDLSRFVPGSSGSQREDLFFDGLCVPECNVITSRSPVPAAACAAEHSDWGSTPTDQVGHPRFDCFGFAGECRGEVDR